MNDDTYTLTIKIKDCEKYTQREFYRIDNSDSSNKEKIQEKNEVVKKLIERAKSRLPKKQKIEIVDKTITEGQNEYKKSQMNGMIATILAYAIIIGIILVIILSLS